MPDSDKNPSPERPSALRAFFVGLALSPAVYIFLTSVFGVGKVLAGLVVLFLFVTGLVSFLKADDVPD